MSEVYTTVQGDKWDSIAYKTLGDVNYTGELMSLNPQHLEHYVFPAGIELVLPEKKVKVSNKLPPWKQVK